MLKTSPFPTTFLQDFPGLWGPRIAAVAAHQFDCSELQKRVLQLTKKKDKAKPAFYIDPRTLDHRLNLMFGGAWSIGFHVEPTQDMLIVRATLNINGIVREDISSEPIMYEKTKWSEGKVVGKEMALNEMCTLKAQASAYKRAAVKFGISAYLYDFKDVNIWLPVNEYKQFKEPGIKMADLPEFARPTPGPQIVLEELMYLCDTEDKDLLINILHSYWGLDTIKHLNRDDSFRLASCIARVSDFISFTGKTLEDLLEDRKKESNKSDKVGFGTT